MDHLRTEIARLNREGHTKCVPVSNETDELLREVLEMAFETDGAFDPTLNLKPPKEFSFRDIVRGQGCYSFARSDGRINLDEIQKGVLVERALDAMKARGATSARVAVGEEAGFFGGDEFSGRWTFDIDQKNFRTRRVVPIRLDEGFISTVSVSEESSFVAVITHASSGLRSRTLALALAAMGRERARRFLLKSPNVAACVIFSDSVISTLVQDDVDRPFCRTSLIQRQDGAP